MKNQREGRQSGMDIRERRFQRNLLLGLLVLALLTPLGIIVPALFKADEPWGEWSAEYLHRALGYIPQGLSRTAHMWSAPAAGYNFGREDASLVGQSLLYVLAALIGLLLLILVVSVASRAVRKHGR